MKNILKKILAHTQIINDIIPKNKKIIVLYSNLGFRDNVKVLFDYLIKSKFNNEYKIICVSNDFYGINDIKYNNVKYVGLKRGLYYFFKAKYFFYCFGKYPIKPSEKQIVINYCHGMPIKKIGNLENGNENVDYNYFTYIISYSDFFKKIIQESFNATDGQVLIDEPPRNDLLVYPKKAMKFNENMEKQIIWMPTYRETENSKRIEGKSQGLLPLINDVDDIKELNLRLCEINCELVVKLHPLQKNNIPEGLKLSNIFFIDDAMLINSGIELYDLLGNSDGLITDYSSVSIDYLLTGKPIGYCIYDIEEYSESRGFNFSNIKDVMTGPFLLSKVDLFNFIEDIRNGNDSFFTEREELRRCFHKYTDGESIPRILNKIGLKRN